MNRADLKLYAILTNRLGSDSGTRFKVWARSPDEADFLLVRHPSVFLPHGERIDRPAVSFSFREAVKRHGWVA